MRAVVNHPEGKEAGFFGTLVGSPVAEKNLQHTGIERKNVILKQTCISRSESPGRLKDLKLETSLGYTASFFKGQR